MEKYFLVINGKPQGPYSTDELKELSIKPGDFVKTAAMDDYKEAHEIAELRQLFHFSKPPVIPQYFAGIDQRLLASAIDWLIILGVYIIPTLIVVLLISNKMIGLVISFSLFILIPITKIIYHIIMECGEKQATYGKRRLNIKVCDMQGNRVNIGRSIARNIFKILSFLPFCIGYLFSFFNKQQQCLHDMLAGALVMKDRLI